MDRNKYSAIKDNILDTAERLYAEKGVEALTVRMIAEGADVNLAAINYYFRTKENLTKAMLSRRLSPLHDERIALLDRYKQALGSRLGAEQVVAAILMPAIRKMSLNAAPQYLPQFFLRCSGDPAQAIRLSMAEEFGAIGKSFDDAFCVVAPSVPRQMVLWRVHTFFNAFSGTIANQNTLLLLREMIDAGHMNDAAIIAHFVSILSLGIGKTDTLGGYKRTEEAVEIFTSLTAARGMRFISNFVDTISL